MEKLKQPLVTVILTAYNQQDYIREALQSVFIQSYSFIQLIVIDNGSTDNTLAFLENALKEHPDVLLIKNISNKGICKAFNQGLALADGKYVIDFSGDDVFFSDRVQKQVNAFELLSEDYIVTFSNVRYISSDSKPLHFHFVIDSAGRALAAVPSGDVYKSVLEKYFICTPSMMIRTKLLKQIGGYDETLAFEDFDFWIRSAVRFRYHYQDEVLTFKRNTPDSLSKQVYKKGSGMLASYYQVCNKAYDLNRDQIEFDLLANRIRTFIRKCFYAGEFDLALKFRKLLNYIENPGLKTECVVFLCRMRLPVNWLYQFYINYLLKF